MALYRSALAALLLVAFICGDVYAHQQRVDINFEPQIHQTRLIRPNFVSKSARYIAKTENVDLPLAVALEYARSIVPLSQFVIKNYYTTKHNGVSHVYLRQIVNGLEVVNGDMNINVNKTLNIVSVGHSFYVGHIPKASFARISPLAAVQAVATYLNAPADANVKLIRSEADGRINRFTGSTLSLQEIPVKLAYIQSQDATLELVWNVNIEREFNWVDTFVNAHNAQLLAVYDWIRDASYNVYPIGVNDPSDGSRTIETDPHLDAREASPLGWHDQGLGRAYTTTIGNNVYAQENLAGGSSWENNYRPTSSSLNFNYPIDFTQEPGEYLDASITNLFFWNNIIHDVFYLYGFDEVSGNFQENNFGLGGLGGDAVQANAQDGSGYNNANFATPPDGQRPRMRMYLWNWDSPMLDGDLDDGIVIHEYAHGISNRLTGGPDNSNCLGTGQAGGMGEGWGDCFSLFFRWRSSYTLDKTFEMGEWAAGEGIRTYPYARDMRINPQTYSYINRPQYNGVHAKGCVWCTVLYDLYLTLVESEGFSPDWYRGTSGSNKALQLVVDGMKLQPCRPTFVDARDAILLADEENYGGAHRCAIWSVFARRGLGVSAQSGLSVTDGFDVPNDC